MYKYLVAIFAFALIHQTGLAQSNLTKEEKKQIKAELKGYMKDPDIYKQTMQRYNQIIDSSKVAMGAKDARINKLNQDIADLKKKEEDMKASIAACESRPAPRCPECACSGNIPNTGVYYKVQVGSVKSYNEKAFAEAKGLSIEKGDNLNHYVFSYFDSKEDAVAFAAELKKLGMQNANVVRYENGQRAVKSMEKKSVLRISEDAPAQPKTKSKVKKSNKRKK